MLTIQGESLTEKELAAGKGLTLVEPRKDARFEQRGAVTVGQVIQRKNGSRWLVLSVGTPYHISPSDCRTLSRDGGNGISVHYRICPGDVRPVYAVEVR